MSEAAARVVVLEAQLEGRVLFLVYFLKPIRVTTLSKSVFEVTQQIHLPIFAKALNYGSDIGSRQRVTQFFQHLVEIVLRVWTIFGRGGGRIIFYASHDCHSSLFDLKATSNSPERQTGRSFI
jgi:hypothetical protein